jgi:hypothetical protein
MIFDDGISPFNGKLVVMLENNSENIPALGTPLLNLDKPHGEILAPQTVFSFLVAKLSIAYYRSLQRLVRCDPLRIR